MTTILRRFTFWLALAGLAALVLFVRANSVTSPMQPPPSPPPEKPFPQGIGASGIVEAMRDNTSLGVPFASLVSEVRVKVWQKVKRGDVLLVLDDREYRLQLKTLRASLSVREAEARRALRKYERYSKLGASAAIAKQDIDQSEDDLAIARAEVERAKAAILETEEYLERYLIRAPIDGTILQVNVRTGEHATPGGATPPLVIGDLTELQIRADVDEQIAPRVREDAKAVAYRKGESGKPIVLKFVRIEPFIVPKKSLTGSSSERVDTRVLQVIFSFSNEDEHRTYVGQQVDVFIEE